jgi:hypothetical protein
MPSLSSLVNSSQYTKENLTFPFVAGMKLGTGYVAPVFTGTNGAASNDPGGVFGWLIYARTALSSPAKGATTDLYISYSNPYDFIGDLNLLSGVTSCLVSATGAGGTYGFFVNTQANVITPRTAGVDLLHALNYFAYGGSLVIVGSAAGLSDYITETGSYFDVIVDHRHDSTLAQWMIDQPYTIGIFPTIPDSSGYTGGGYTLANFTTLFGSASYVTGATSVGKRVFNVCGLKTQTDIDTTSIQENTKLTYTTEMTNDVAGFFARTKSRNESYLSVAGLDRSNVINGNVINSVNWDSNLKTTLKNNRANFFVNYDPKFLGSDLVGATAGTSITVNDRVGPARMRANLNQSISAIILKYVFDINNQTTRNQVISDIQTALEPYTPFLDTTKTQITCDSTNNQENSDTLTVSVVVQPILSTESFIINLSYTQQ